MIEGSPASPAAVIVSWLALYFELDDLDGRCRCGKRALVVYELDEDGEPAGTLRICPWCLASDGAFRISKIEVVVGG